MLGRRITSLEGLGQGNAKIVLLSSKIILDFSSLEFIYKVVLYISYGLVDGRCLSGVKNLTISSCCNFIDPSSLSNCTKKSNDS